MALSPEEVRKVAQLAHLELSADEEARLAGELSQILEYMERLTSLDTEGVAPLDHVHEATCPMRDDEVRPSLPVDDALANAPEKEGTSIVVPKIIGDGS